MKVLIAAGGTGGHILPALRISEELSQKKDIQILLAVGSRDIERTITSSFDYRVVFLKVNPLKLKVNKEGIVSFFNLFKTFFKSLYILLKFKPNITLGFGGYASFFLVFFSWLLGKKTVIHEENVLMGRANRLLAPFARRITLGFAKTYDDAGFFKNKMVFTGNPLRKELKIIPKEEARSYFNLSNHNFTILVTGGSLGAHKINQEFCRAVSLLAEKFAFQVIHLSGEKDYDFLIKEYAGIKIKIKLFKFIKEMHYVYSASDLVICRAGAMTISELIYFKLPAIIVPYPYAYGHQLYNARILSDPGCALLCEDKNFNYHVLQDILLSIFSFPEKLKEMQENYRRIKNQDSKNLWEVILSFN